VSHHRGCRVDCREPCCVHIDRFGLHTMPFNFDKTTSAIMGSPAFHAAVSDPLLTGLSPGFVVRLFANALQCAYSLATVAPSLTASILKLSSENAPESPCFCLRRDSQHDSSASVLPLVRVSMPNASINWPYFTSVLLQASGSSSTALSCSAKRASSMRCRAASPFSVVGLATAA